MSAKKIIGFVFIITGLILVIGFMAYSYFNSQSPTAGIKISTTPPSQVFIDNALVGITPLEKVLKEGDVSVKLVPDSTSLSPYQTQVHLVSGTYTVIHRDFDLSDAASAGEVISLQKNTDSASSLSIVTSSPDSAAISVDSQPQGFTPLLISTLPPGDHRISISAPGYKSREIVGKVVSGYKLTISVKLSADALPPAPTTLPTPIATPSGILKSTPKVTPKPTISTLPKPYVTIQKTPTGFLRVRSSPSLGGAEVGRINPGESFPLLGSKPGWYEIKAELDATSSGWISSQYATKSE